MIEKYDRKCIIGAQWYLLFVLETYKGKHLVRKESWRQLAPAFLGNRSMLGPKKRGRQLSLTSPRSWAEQKRFVYWDNIILALDKPWGVILSAEEAPAAWDLWRIHILISDNPVAQPLDLRIRRYRVRFPAGAKG